MSAAPPFHKHLPFGASERVKRSVWAECGCDTCRRLLRRDDAGENVTDAAAPGQEDALTVAVALLLTEILPPEVAWTHIPNGGKRSKATAGKLLAMGTRRGAPDFVLVVPPRLTVWIELKTVSGVLSIEQRAWRDALVATQGARWAVCRSVGEVQKFLADAGLTREPSALKRAG